MQRVNTAVVVTAMQKIDSVLPGHTQEIITALSFMLVERSTEAGLSLDEMHHHVDVAFRSRKAARN